MANVSSVWVEENVRQFYCFGGIIQKEDLPDREPEGGFETTLTAKGVRAVEDGEYERKFHILIPGAGWADCFPWDPGNGPRD